ncbi:MAG: hypothetical protein AAFX90_22205 [Pseudomonadota bacterium]
MLKISVFPAPMTTIPMGAMADGQNHRSAQEDFEVSEDTFGITPGERCNPTKGICFAGEFSTVGPTNLSDGFAGSDDPILAARSAIRAQGMGVRSGET